MKISEIRNKMFGLSDLKGLINENAFGEHRGGYDWRGYFAANPERLNQSFLQTMGLTSAPKEPISIDQIGDSEFRKHFGDEETMKVLSNPINFKKNMGVRNAYDSTRKDHKSTFQGKQNGTTLLKTFFIENGGGNISNTPILSIEQGINSDGNLNREILEYFYAIKELAGKAGEFAKENQITDFNSTELVGVVENPFSMFLYFFFRLFISGSGKWGPQYDFNKNIRPEFMPYIDRVMGEVKSIENSTIADENKRNNIPALIQTTLLEPVGLQYTGELYKYSDILYQNFFANRGGIEKLIDFLKLINTNLSFQNAISMGKNGVGKMAGTIGSVIYMSLIILKTSDSNQKNLINNIREYMGGDDMAIFRSTAYLTRYELKTKQIISDDIKDKLVKCFGFSYQNEAFDPLRFIDFISVTDGLKKWIVVDDLRTLLKSVINVIADQKNDSISKTSMCPAEKIFLAARDINNLLKDTNYEKYGAGPRDVTMTIGLLLGDAGDALRVWKEASPGEITAPLAKLQAIYDSEKTNKTNEDLSFWRLLSRVNVIKDRTQSDIYYWLITHTDPSVEWAYEYNRYEKIDSDLGGKSIDIMGTAQNNTYCFEYQGEQHYRPLTVSYTDYKEFPLYTQMRDYILEQCGFMKKSIGGTKFYVGPENADAGRMHEVRAKIIEAYKKFYQYLPGVNNGPLKTPATIKQRMEEGKSFVPTVNRKKISDQEVVKYFQKVMSESPDNIEIFKNPPVEGFIPYIGSPRRFLDEIKTAQDMGRDMVKREIIRQRENLGWHMSYIIPRKATFDEKEYTEQLAGNKNNVFTWDKEGKNKLLSFLQQNQLLKITTDKKNTLFEEIVKEFLLGGGC